jgi:hypothetical protein
VKRYGVMAMRYWARWWPAAYARISDPDHFFTELGDEAARQVEELADHAAGEDRPDAGYLDRVARLFTARTVAEEVILPQRVRPDPEPAATDDLVDPAG